MIVDFCLENGYSVLNLDFSPVKGPEGNIEYLIHIRKSESPELLTDVDPEQLVELSHKTLAN
jgi:23S rRNA (cytidine1920-2'-O)/16S rRNA (cytidine1409-2'-O)-methyltransferase